MDANTKKRNCLLLRLFVRFLKSSVLPTIQELFLSQILLRASEKEGTCQLIVVIRFITVVSHFRLLLRNQVMCHKLILLEFNKKT